MAEEELHRAILKAFSEFAWLSNDKSCGVVPVPSIHRNVATFLQRWFRYAGRPCFQDLLDFAQGLMAEEEWPEFLGVESEGEAEFLGEERVEAEGKAEVHEEEEDNRPAKQPRITLGGGVEAYVIGPPGEGKSYLLAVLAGYLHTQGSYIVVYISAKTFSDATLRSSLRLAFARDADVLQELSRVSDNDLLNWLASKPKLMVLVDDFNELDDKRELHHGNLIATMALEAITPDKLLPVSDVKSALKSLSINHVVLYCCSCGSEVRIRSALGSEPHPPYLVIAGGLSETELKTYERRVLKQFIPSGAFSRTGHNPRLLRLFVEGKLESELEIFRESIQRFIFGLGDVDYERFTAQLAGDQVWSSLPQAMNARCFFSSAGELKAICDHLYSVALSLCAIRDNTARTEAVEKHIDHFTRVVKLDGGSNMTRVGWNSEEATVLVFSSLSVSIPLPDFTWNFKAARTKAFRGGIENVRLEGGNRHIAHIPDEFNWKAVDLVLEGKGKEKTVCAGVQISVSSDPQVGHGGAIHQFCSVMKASRLEYDILVFVWTGYFPGNIPPVKVKVAGVEVIEVTMSFSSLSSVLTDLDLVCEQVRTRQLQTEERAQCLTKTAKGDRCTLTVKPDAATEYCHVHMRQQARGVNN